MKQVICDHAGKPRCRPTCIHSYPHDFIPSCTKTSCIDAGTHISVKCVEVEE